MLDAEQILREQSAMEQARQPFEEEWRDVARLMLPSMASSLDNTEFSQSMWSRPIATNIYDETAMLSLNDGCSVFEGEVIPEGTTWQRLRARDDDLMKRRHIALWYENLTARVFALRNAAQSGFILQAHESVKHLLAFGVQGMWPELAIDPRSRQPNGISYRSEHIGQLYLRDDHRGMVETTHRKFRLTHRQALSKWPDSPPECAEKAGRDARGNSNALDGEATYIHRIAPNPRYDPGRIDWLGKPFLSCYLSVADKQVFDIGGYRTRRLIVSRFEKGYYQPYGRGPAMNVLPAVKAAQEIMADLVTAIEFMARPVLGAHDDMMDQILQYEPGGVSYGAIDARGNQMVKRLWDDPDIGPALQLQRDVRNLIERAFYQDLYVVRQEVKTHVSAFERMQRDQQRGVLLAPFKRQETEWFTPLLEVELDLMMEMGMLDDMPQEVREAGGLYQIVYENPLGRAREADKAAGFYSLLDGLTPLMQLNPQETVQTFFQRYPFDKVLAVLGPVHGVPVAMQASEEEEAASKSQAAALAEEASILEVGERASAIAGNLAGVAPAP